MSTGITRKIDELGRVVIPKEIRKNLNIREGESLEIITNEDNIILKKHSQIAKYEEISQKLCKIISNIYGVDVIVTDREKVIACSCNVIDKKINTELTRYIDSRESYVSSDIKDLFFEDIVITGYITIYPIIDESNSIGLVIIKSDRENDIIKLCKLISKIIIG